ncbi:8806_t:CDS:2, partial [Rhizophagus irregularis]
VLYVAISNTPSWELARANAIAELPLSLIGLQSRYNLLDRSLEFVLQPACVGILLWGVTAESFLTGKYTRKSAVALNWVQQNCSTIGARAAAQLEENLKSLEFKMSPEQMKQLDEVSKPTEIPFPYSYVLTFLIDISEKTLKFQKNFEPVVSTYNFERIHNN